MGKNVKLVGFGVFRLVATALVAFMITGELQAQDQDGLTPSPNAEPRSAQIFQFPTSQTHAAQLRVTDILNTTGGLDLNTEYQEFEVRGLPALHMILSRVADQLDAQNNSRTFSTRLNALNYLAWRMSQESQTRGNPELLAAIAEKANVILEHPKTEGPSKTFIAQIFNHLNLWSARNFWYFKKFSRDIHGLSTLRHGLRQVLPLITAQQAQELAEDIRSHRPRTLGHLAVLVDMRHVRENELMLFFEQAAKEYGNRVAPHGVHVSSVASDEIRDLTASALDELTSALHTEAPIITHAYMSARERILKLDETPNRSARLWFLDQIKTGRVNWRDKESWTSPPPPPRYTVEDGNVIRLNMNQIKSCQIPFSN